MSESSLLEVEDVDLGDNALQDLIQEAETLMNDLPLDLADSNIDTNAKDSAFPKPTNEISSDGAGLADLEITPKLPSSANAVTSADTRAAINIGGNFSIDDDDDEIVGDSHSNNNNIFDDDPLRVVEPTVPAPMAGPKLDDHPLSAASLSNTTAPPTTGTKNLTATSPQLAGNTMSNIFNGSGGMGGVMKMNMGINMGRGTGTAGEAAAAGMDTISKTTSLFASNLASMAHRGMAQVAAATAPVHPVNVMGGPGGMMQGQGMNSQTTGMSQHWSNGMKKSTFSSTTTAPNSNSSDVGVGTGSGWNSANPSGCTQLDKDQKSNLLKKHVGDLLEGERIIMFMTNLLHVSDTSGLSFVASQQQHSSQGMWCCVMTYYRLILFSTADADADRMEPPTGWDRNCWQAAAPPSTSIRLLKMPLASIDRVEKTIYQK